MNNMNTIYVRYGETLNLEGTLDADMGDVESVTLYVGKTGPNAPKLTVQGVIEGLNVTLREEAVELPLGEYKYQINLVYTDGTIEKYPDMHRNCIELPDFIVTEVVDEVEETNE